MTSVFTAKLTQLITTSGTETVKLYQVPSYSKNEQAFL